MDFLGKSIQRLQGVLTNAESDFKKFSSTYTDIVSPKTSGGEATKFKSFSEQVEEARLLVSTLNGELNALRAGQGNDIPDFAQAIEDKEKQLKDAQNKLNTLLGIDPKKSKRIQTMQQRHSVSTKNHTCGQRATCIRGNSIATE